MVPTRRLSRALSLLLAGLLLACGAVQAKDCEFMLEHRQSANSATIKVVAGGANKGETRSIQRNHLRFIKNRKAYPIELEISRAPGSSQKRWITLYALNQREPVTGYYPPGVSLYQVRCPTTPNVATISNPSSCPVGGNGKVCSGNGSCSAATGTCRCESDFRGNACQTMSLRCYGAIGDNCGAADGFNFGLCAGNRCMINAGSWEHDECCVAYRKNGPAPTSQQGSCTPPSPQACAARPELPGAVRQGS